MRIEKDPFELYNVPFAASPWLAVKKPHTIDNNRTEAYLMKDSTE